MAHFISTSSLMKYIPIPIVDIAAVTAIQLDMLRQLCKLYDQDYNDSSGKAFVGTLVSNTLSKITAHTVGAIFKVLPIIGSAMGGVTVVAFSGATTYAIGQVIAQHFVSGGSMDEFDAEELKDFYKEQFQKGKEVVEEWTDKAAVIKVEVEEEIQDAIDDIFEEKVDKQKLEIDKRLAKLDELQAAGLVTDLEYKRIKKRILK